MRFTPTRIDGAWLVTSERIADERGHFTRAFCTREFADQGLEPVMVQSSLSFNRVRGTLRGMHWQAAPAAEAKLVRPIRGAIHDVIADIRPGSPTYMEHVAVQLAADDGVALYVPPLCAHGFQTLADETEVLYSMSEYHSPEHARGFRFDDPAFGIRWPIEITAISDADRTRPDFVPAPRAVTARA